jgi:ASC-1-like (ASCH) protein
MTNCHLVILKKPYLDAILRGEKRIESRLLKTKISFLDYIKTGDKIFFKVSSGPVYATAIVRQVKLFENLTPRRILEIKQQYNNLICGSEQFWQEKLYCRYACLVWLENVKRIEPFFIEKKDWRAWVMLTEKENFGIFDLMKKGKTG